MQWDNLERVLQPLRANGKGGVPGIATRGSRSYRAGPGSERANEAGVPTEQRITGIAYDSRRVRPGYVFVAIPGHRQDGAAFIEDAVARGAAVIVAEMSADTPRGIPCVRVSDAREALARVSNAFHDYPARRLDVIGITGTNGKTSTAYMIKAILARAGRAPGLISSVAYEMGERSIPAVRTTPEAPDLHAMMDQMLEAGCRSAVMEVSSHALHQKRVAGIDFSAGVFTNLTRDHLEYHGSMEQYAAAKAKLFTALGPGARAVLNMDDPTGRWLAGLADLRADVITYGTAEGAMVRAADIQLGAMGSHGTVHSPWGTGRIRLCVPGRYNVSNALAALAACGAMGIDLRMMTDALAGVTAVRGRMEPVPNNRGLRVFVDYAHTDDALVNVLEMIREITPGRVLLVFGCGGDRDRGKRPKMGAVAARGADHVFVTSDNPRGEDPESILRDIVSGFEGRSNYTEIVDRESAIAEALKTARPDDTVLIAGKGHENYQEFSHTIVPFDDVEVARRIMDEMSVRAPGRGQTERQGE